MRKCSCFLGNYTKGERVAGCVHGGLNPELDIRGAYSEYVVQEASLVFRYPSTISPESAATIPLASITAALGLFHEMNLPLPPATCGTSILVWAGSTSVGQYAIQLAKASGCFVITTASPARHDYLKELGADICFDYKDPNVVSQIKQAAKETLAYAFDCISEKE
jgi:NADPH:quinone reductase-like Zn-dependent oxidoreductase